MRTTFKIFGLAFLLTAMSIPQMALAVDSYERQNPFDECADGFWKGRLA